MIDALGAQCRLVEDILMHGGLRTGWTKTCRKERDPLWGIGRSNTYLYIFFAQHGHSTASYWSYQYRSRLTPTDKVTPWPFAFPERGIEEHETIRNKHPPKTHPGLTY